MAETFGVRVGPKGRIVVPVELRRELGIEEGAELLARAEAGSLVIEPRSRALDRLQSLVRQAVPARESLVDELLAARRDEARREHRQPRRARRR